MQCGVTAMECFVSRWKVLSYIIAGIGLTGGSLRCIWIPGAGPKIIGVMGVVYFGPILGRAILWFWSRGPQITIDQFGITDARDGIGRIVWSDVKEMHVGLVQGRKHLFIKVADENKYLGRLSAWRRVLVRLDAKLGFPGVSISFAGLSPGIDQVWLHLRQSWPEKCRAEPSAALDARKDAARQ